MTASVRQQIVTAAIALLNTSRPSGVPQADETRLESYTPAELPAMTVFRIREEGESEKEGRWSYFVKRTFTLRIELRFASDTAPADMDSTYVWVGQQLGQQQFGPSANGGTLAEDCYETLLEWQYADADQPYTLLQIDFRVEYSTLKEDPTRTQ
jgi:hypothetical protein